MRRIALLIAGCSLLVFLAASNALAQVVTETTTSNSAEFGFNPQNLINAVTGVGVGENAGKCFICPNTSPGAGGTTAGALTNSMFGEIRKNSEADVPNGDFPGGTTRPEDQDPAIPTQSGSCGTDCNDSGAFTFSIPLPVMDFLDADDPDIDGVRTGGTSPTVAGTVGAAGVKMKFSNTFEYFDGSDGINAEGSSTFAQTMSQTTFTGGSEGNEVQIVEFESNGENAPRPFLGGSGGRIFWRQSIEEGGFNLGPLEGSFIYNVGGFEKSSAPTGAGQSIGVSGQEIGTD